MTAMATETKTTTTRVEQTTTRTTTRVEHDSEDIHDIPLRRLSKYSASLYDIGCEGISAKLVLFLGRRYIPSIDGISGVSGSPIFCAIGLSNTAAPDVQGVLG